MSDGLAEARKEYPSPFTNMDYLDGYLDFVYSDDDAPDGAWFQMCVDTIQEHWPDCDAHECFMQYLLWKNPQKDEQTMNQGEQE